MREVICVVGGLFTGGIMGVTLMCIFQINRINQYERKILILQKQIAEERIDVT